MTSCHNAANEFLRQYWSAILPAQAGALGTTTPAIKLAKAGKMAAYLRGMEGKINAVVHTAATDGLDPARVRAVSHTSAQVFEIH
jgi:transcription initiation factor TFIIH subunit 1